MDKQTYEKEQMNKRTNGQMDKRTNKQRDK